MINSQGTPHYILKRGGIGQKNKNRTEDAEAESVRKIHEESAQEAAKEEFKKEIEARVALNDLTQRTEHVLMDIKTKRIFALSEEEITIDLSKVTIIFRKFLGGESVQTFLIKQIADVRADLGLFYGSLRISDMFNPAEHTVITHLSKDEAIEARRIIQGLVVAAQNGVDLTRLRDNNIKRKLIELGKAHEG